MQHLFYFLGFMIMLSSCEKNRIEKTQNSLISIEGNSPIEIAEKEYGPLVKADYNYFDSKTGSSFKFRVASRTKAAIENHMKETEYSFFGVNQKEKDEILSQKSRKYETPISPNTNEESNTSNTNNDVFAFQLVEKKLGPGIIGFGVEVRNKNLNKENLRTVNGWEERVAPIQFAERMWVYPHNFSPYYSDAYNIRKRGLFWNNFVVGWARDNYKDGNGLYVIDSWDVDGFKYTKVGSYAPFFDYFTVIWYDLESDTWY